MKKIITQDIAYPLDYIPPKTQWESDLETKKLKKDLKRYAKMMEGLSGSHNQNRFKKEDAFETLNNNFKFLQSKDSYMQFKMFGGPKSMEAYARKKQGIIDKREDFRKKFMDIHDETVIEEDLENDSDAPN